MNTELDATRSKRSRLWAEIVLALTVLLLSVGFVELHVDRNRVFGGATIEKLSAGEGETPYQHRVLVPWIVGRIAAHLPAVSQMDIAKALEAASVLLLFYALRALLETCAGSRAGATLAALGLFYVLPFQYLFPQNWPFWYVYDLPAVLFFTLGLVCIQRRRWWLYYPLLALASLNRETAVFLIPAFVLAGFRRMRLLPLAAHALAQCAIWYAIKHTIDETYKFNVGIGGVYRHALRDNLATISDPHQSLLLASNLGFLWIPLLLLARRIEDGFARRVLLVLPVFLAVAFKTGVFDELRIHGEMIPLVLLGITCIARSYLRPPLRAPVLPRQPERSGSTR